MSVSGACQAILSARYQKNAVGKQKQFNLKCIFDILDDYFAFTANK